VAKLSKKKSTAEKKSLRITGIDEWQTMDKIDYDEYLLKYIVSFVTVITHGFRYSEREFNLISTRKLRTR
jgi:hypothetical protein